MGKKFLTFSYDDGTIYDRRLVDLLNKYGLKCTFNLNSGLFEHSYTLSWDDYSVEHTKIRRDEVADLYKGHEVASHSISHPRLSDLNDADVIHEVEDDRKALSELCGYEVRGFAYPGGPFYTADTIAAMKRGTGVEYARATFSTLDFKVPDNWFEWQPSAYHGDGVLNDLAQRFIDAESDEDLILYIFGHSYEIEAWNAWDRMEEFFKFVSGREGITYATNIEIKDYICGKNK